MHTVMDQFKKTQIDHKQLSLNEIIMAFNQVGKAPLDTNQMSSTMSSIAQNEAIHASSSDNPSDFLTEDVLNNLSGFFTDQNQMDEALRFEMMQNARAERDIENIDPMAEEPDPILPEDNFQQSDENVPPIQQANYGLETSYNPERIYVVETERVINQSNLTEELKCRICHGVLLNPMECNKCENCFCMSCLQKWLKESGTCPFKCNGTLDFKLKPHKVIRNMLTQLVLKCRNYSNGCKEEIPYEKLEVHEEVECKFECYPCPEKEAGC